MMADLESDRIEHTETLKNTEKYCEAICAFANDFPGNGRAGYLLIGVTSQGRAAGLTITDQFLQTLGGLRDSGKIQPRPTITVQRIALSNRSGEVAVVEVQPSDMAPVRYDGRVWIRVGPRRSLATESEERILTERRAATLARSFDARPCAGVTLSDLALDLYRGTYLPAAVSAEVLEENHRELRVQMASLRLFDLARDCPTHAAVLLFGSNPLQSLPGAWIQFVRYAGDSLDSDVLDDKSLSGDMLTLLRQIESLIPIQIERHPVSVGPLREETVQSYPVVAVREIIMNAVMHRNYELTATPIRFYWFSDRVEVQSPGGLYGEATRANFPRQNAYRNPVLAEALKNLGFVNRFGRGVERAQAAMARNGSPPIAFEFDAHFVLATLRRRS